MITLIIIGHISKKKKRQTPKKFLLIQKTQEFKQHVKCVFLFEPRNIIIFFFCTFFRTIVDGFLIVEMFGCCCVYVVFVAKNLKEVTLIIKLLNYSNRKENILFIVLFIKTIIIVWFLLLFCRF